MIEVGGVWLPDGEQHLVEWMTKRDQWIGGKLTYQYNKMGAALAKTKAFNGYIDIGAHCGLWTMVMAPLFRAVLAVEPMPRHIECFHANTRGMGNVTLVEAAAGNARGRTTMHTTPESTGDTWVLPTARDGDVDVIVVDELTADMDVDLIKLDTEGYELFALQGMEQTIERCRPTIVVEQKPGHAQRFGLGERDAVRWLEFRNYRTAKVMSGDYIMVPA